MDWDNIDEKKFKALIKQILGTITKKDGDLVPYHIIKGTGRLYCYQPALKSMTTVIRNTKVYVLDMGNKEDTHCLVYTENGRMVTINKDELEEIGFN
tara:strand:- start:88 stop:378 length:291 start_codon:yes stop_codon:yes gene_type:complete